MPQSHVPVTQGGGANLGDGAEFKIALLSTSRTVTSCTDGIPTHSARLGRSYHSVLCMARLVTGDMHRRGDGCADKGGSAERITLRKDLARLGRGGHLHPSSRCGNSNGRTGKIGGAVVSFSNI